MDASTFWDQTQASFGAAVRGRFKAMERAREAAMFGAWWTDRFAREDRLLGLGHYLKKLKAPKSQGAKDKLAFFHSLRVAGVPIKITRIGKKAQAAPESST